MCIRFNLLNIIPFEIVPFCINNSNNVHIFSWPSIDGSEEIHIICSSTISCVCSPETNHPLKNSSKQEMSATERLELSGSCKPHKFSFLWETSGHRALCAWECCHGEATSCVPAKGLIISFALILIHAIKQ